MFSILAIFSFIILLFLASLKIIDWVFTNQKKIKPNYLKIVFTAFYLFLWFSFSAILTIFISAVLLKLPQILVISPQNAIADVALEQQDCPQLIDTIYTTENQIYKVENHRYIEESAPIFTIKLEYQKGADKLNSAAEQYLSLDVAKNSQHYVQQLAQELQKKAQLFKQRTEIVENNKGLKQIVNLLNEMDRVTKQRQSIINIIEKQCNS